MRFKKFLEELAFQTSKDKDYPAGLESGVIIFDPHERYEISEKYCPICQMKIVSKDMIYDYSLKILGGKEKVSEDMKNMFKTYDEYKNFIKDETKWK